MKKFSKSLVVATSVFSCFSVQAANDVLVVDRTTGRISVTPYGITQINNNIQGVNFSALENVLSDGRYIKKSIISPKLVPKAGVSGLGTNGINYYPYSSISGVLNGHNVIVSTLGGKALGGLGLGGSNGSPKIKLVDADTLGKITKNTRNVKLQGLTSDTVLLNIDDKIHLSSSQILSTEDVLGLAQTLDILPGLNTTKGTTLGPMSPSGLTSQIFYDKLTPQTKSHKENHAAANRTDGINFSLADVKFEQVQFNKGGESGSIQGVVLAMSTEIAGVEVGAYIPYDYLSFKSFDAHRTGGMIYAKRDWQLPMNLQLSTMADFSGIATYVTKFSLTGTVGGGIGTSLSYDDGGDFVPRISFAFQYNRDYYPVVGKYIKDNEQFLVKMGGSFGYRLFENGTLNAGVTYTRDVTGYTSIFNKTKDNDYFDISVGGSYALSDMWQVNLTYKRILGLQSYYTNAVFLGTSIGF